MKIRLVTPQSSVKRTGNRCTAWQWQEILVSLGIEVSTDEESDCDVLIALHASRSFEAISRFREESPKGKLVVALSGSDIYPQPDGPALRSIKIADRLVALQPRAIRQIHAEFGIT
ncbi:MAG: TIGR04348 family glycosyltransferase, partial [Verrucomicrobiota bacterium]